MSGEGWMSDEAVQQTESISVSGLYRGRPHERFNALNRVSQWKFVSIDY
jgi:hypothetical protein